MFRSVRLKSIITAVISVACALVFAIVCLLALKAGAPDTVTINGENYSLRAETGGDIEAFIRVCGFEPVEAVSDREITVPEIWNEVYTDYCEMQKEQGFSLAPYKGKSARELIYSAEDSGEYITLLISDKKIIAAHKSLMDGSGPEPVIQQPSGLPLTNPITYFEVKP